MKNGWEFKKLSDVMLVERGGSPRPIQKYLTNDPDGLNWIKISDATASTKYIYRTKEKIKKEGLHKTRQVQDGDFLLSNSMSFGRPYIMRTTGCIHDGWLVLHDKKAVQLDQDFLYHILSSPNIFQQFDQLAAGSTVRNLNIGLVSSVKIPIPPIDEQKRIVAILDEAFEAIDKAKQNAEKNLQNARELFESYLQSVFSQRADGWVETTLGKEIDLLAGFAFKSSQYTTSDDSIRLLRGDNIVQGSLRWDDVKKWPASDFAEYERYDLHAGDVLLAMDRPWVKAGLKRAQMSQDDLPCLLVQRTARLRGNGTLDNRFLFHLISSTTFMQYILGVQTGSGVPHISGQQIKDFAFIRPPVSQQKQIVAGLDGLSEQVGRLESVYRRKLAALDELKKSLLNRAFNGNM